MAALCAHRGEKKFMKLIIITRLMIALGLGLIIGLERGWSSREEAEGSGSDGLRNFGLVGLLGGVAALLAEQFGLVILAVIFLGLAILIITSYILTAKQFDDYGTTTEIVLLITFSLGALVINDLALEALAVTVIITWLLKFKAEIRQGLRWLQRQELIATLQLLLVAAVALPLLPNQNLGPWQAINPRAIGFLVLLILAISYIGYFILRLTQNKVGILLTGLLGGLASSTATTIALSRLAKQSPRGISMIATAIALASAMMSPRLLLEIAVINSSLAKQLAIPLILLTLIPMLIAVILIIRGIKHQESSVPFKLSNPIEMGLALQYAVILVVLALLVKGAENWFGETGVYILSSVSGLADVDAVSIALARAANQTMSLSVARTSIFLAVIMNTLVKVVLAKLIGGNVLARWCGMILFSTLAVSGLTLWLI